MSARTTRRALFGASAAALTLFGVAGASKPAELDRRLLDLAADLVAVQAEIDANSAATFEALDVKDGTELKRLDVALDGLQDKFWPIANEMEGTPARTPESVQAKAKVLRDRAGRDRRG